MTSWREVVATGILSGLVASFLWLLLFRRFRPKIQISEQIALSRLDGPISYRVKVLNKSRFDLLDMRLEFTLVEPRNMPGGTIYHRVPLSVRPAELVVLPAKPWMAWRDKKKFPDATRIKLDEDLDAVWTDRLHTNLRLRISGKHSLSGVGRSFEVEFHEGSCIVEGSFRTGRVMEIVRDPAT